MEIACMACHRRKFTTMNANNILQSNLLDIIFEGRNKLYGAYDLRSTYNKRIKQSIAGMLAVCLLFITGILMANAVKKNDHIQMAVKDVVLSSVPTEDKKEVIIEQPKPKPVEIKTISFTPPVIVEDELVTKPEVPTDEAVDNIKIGTQNKEGDNIDNVGMPPENIGTGKVELPGNKEEEDDFPAIVQIEAKFPGGIGAWSKYLERTLNTSTPIDNGAPTGKYTVVLSFIVDKEGNVSDVQALNDPGYGTVEEAIKVIKKSKQWLPAVQNGRNVNYRQKQAITFVVTEEG
jgi:protein TonB